MKNVVLLAVLAMSTFSHAGIFPALTGINPAQPVVQSGGPTVTALGERFAAKPVITFCVGPVCNDRSTQRISSTQLSVQMLPGDLVSPVTYVVHLIQGNGLFSTFYWRVTDGTVVISPENQVTGVGQTIQFSATSTIVGDSITWSLIRPFPNAGGGISQSGLFTAPSTLSGQQRLQFGVVATSTVDGSKQSVVNVTIE